MLPAKNLAGPAHGIALRYGANPHQKPAHAYVSKGELPFGGEWVFILQTLETGSNMCCTYQEFQWIKYFSELLFTSMWRQMFDLVHWVRLHTGLVQSFVHSYRLMLLLSWLYGHRCDAEVRSCFQQGKLIYRFIGSIACQLQSLVEQILFARFCRNYFL